MYIPKSFKVDDLDTLQQFMQAHNFATLITSDGGVPIATHLPFLLDTDSGQYGTLIAHMAKANSQWKTLNKDLPLLVIFQGPHAYISSSWYEPQTKIPTWNYTAVHVYGKPRIIHDVESLNRSVTRLALHHDPDLIDTNAHYPESKLNAIVGIEVEIERIEGKYKLSQNKSESDRERVVNQLALSSHAEDQTLGIFMRDYIDENSD